MLVKTSDLRMLDVVNIGDGRRLGNVYDLDLDVETGEILAIILPGEGGFLGLGRRPDIEIPWNRIVRIGGRRHLGGLARSEHRTGFLPATGTISRAGSSGAGKAAAEALDFFWQSRVLAAVPGVVHGVSTRHGGVSRPPYTSLNMGFHTATGRKTWWRTAGGGWRCWACGLTRRSSQSRCTERRSPW